MESLFSAWTEFCKESPKILDKYPPLKDLQIKAGLKPEQFAAAFVCFAILLIYTIFGGSLIVNVVGFVYPAMQSVQVLSNSGDNEAELKQWLTYWVVFALFNVLEMAGSLVDDFIPFYFPLKCSFLWWCWAPGIHGATAVYNVARPHLRKVLMIKD